MLYSEQMKLIIDKFGLDPSTLPDNLYSTLLDAIYNLDVGSGGGKPTQRKNVTIDENGTTNIVPDSGYTLSQVTVNVDVEDRPTQMKSIDVTENGDVSVTPDNGYVLSRVDINVDVEGESTPTQTKTIDITTNGTTEVTPDSGYALSKVTVNTTVASSGGGGGGDDVASAIVSRTITEYVDNSITTIGDYAFHNGSKLTTVNCPSVTTIGDYAFRECSKLTNVNFPSVTTIGDYAFYECDELTNVNFPSVTTIGDYAFYGCYGLTSVEFPLLTGVSACAFRNCYGLTSVEFPLVTGVYSSAFYNCYVLKTIILRKDSIVTLSNTNAFTNCHHLHGTVNGLYNPDGLKDCYIYVPSVLVESYKTASNWSKFATQFRALEDYTVDGTTTGALDESKI